MIGSIGQFKQRVEGALVAVSVLFAIGLVISNLFLMNIGWADFALIRVSYVLVGLCFVCYVSIPLAIVAVPYVLSRHGDGRWRTHVLLRWIMPPLAVLACIMVLPWLLRPFVSDGVAAGAPLRIHGIVWSLWATSAPGLAGILIVVSAFASILYDRPKRAVGHRPKGRIFAMVVGCLMLPVPYSFNVFPNINRAVGGGQPAFANISFDRPIPDLPGGVLLPTQGHTAYTYDSLLILYGNDSHLYVAPYRRQQRLQVYLLRAENVLSVQLRPARIRLGASVWGSADGIAVIESGGAFVDYRQPLAAFGEIAGTFGVVHAFVSDPSRHNGVGPLLDDHVSRDLAIGDRIVLRAEFKNHGATLAMNTRMMVVTGQEGASIAIVADNAQSLRDSIAYQVPSDAAVEYVPGSVRILQDLHRSLTVPYGQSGDEVATADGLNVGEIERFGIRSVFMILRVVKRARALGP